MNHRRKIRQNTQFSVVDKRRHGEVFAANENSGVAARTVGANNFRVNVETR